MMSGHKLFRVLLPVFFALLMFVMTGVMISREMNGWWLPLMLFAAFAIAALIEL